MRKYAKIKNDLIEAQWNFIPGNSANFTSLWKAVDWLSKWLAEWVTDRLTYSVIDWLNECVADLLDIMCSVLSQYTPGP